jgi:hypothetical protein
MIEQQRLDDVLGQVNEIVPALDVNNFVRKQCF